MSLAAPERPVLLPGWIEQLYGPDPVVFGAPRYGPLEANGGAIARTCVCDCAQGGGGPTCWQCGRPARGTRLLLQTAI